MLRTFAPEENDEHAIMAALARIRVMGEHMFQNFEATTTPETGPARLAALQAEMARHRLNGLIVPRADRFQGEYVAAADERLAWLTGFTGSAGFAIILADHAGVFVDGRYRLQVREQIHQVFTPVNWPETAEADWLSAHLPQGGKVGFDPWLHTLEQIRKLEAALSGSGIELVPHSNLIDAIRTDRPLPPRGVVNIQDIEFTGESAASKRARLATQNRMIFLGAPDAICWLLNIRGRDIARNPIVHAYAMLAPGGGVHLFTDAEIGPDLIAHLGQDVTLKRLNDIIGWIEDFAEGHVEIDPSTCPQAVYEALAARAPQVKLHENPDPCRLPKACKTSAEIDGARAAHLRDGAAMVHFLAWLDSYAETGKLTEIDIVKRLEEFRRETGALKDISFDTICGAGANGAIVHYRVTQASNAALKPGQLLLVDSGGQYQDGTTDITRTLAVGKAGADEKACYTRVLQGLIAISEARFPKGVRGSDLDVLARMPLWQAGLDYDHGTGHGVGSYLCVHEGPQALSRRSNVALEPGMILSNEPGYYREGAFGIRLENLIVVQPAKPIDGGDDREMLEFETLTHTPFDRRLILVDKLSTNERAWINTYHRATLKKMAPLVDADAQGWLEAACADL